jgi:hypothetical protein
LHLFRQDTHINDRIRRMNSLHYKHRNSLWDFRSNANAES